MIYELAPIELHEDRIGGMCDAALRRVQGEIDLSHRRHQRDIGVRTGALWLEIAPPVRSTRALVRGESVSVPKQRYFWPGWRR